ncbi:MAG: DUF5678 domain-containing protein [Nanoarchaeota archaeon]
MTYADYEWFLKENLNKYAGKWIAIINNQVVASGQDVVLVVKEAKAKYPAKRPFLAKVRNTLHLIN